MKWFKRKQIDAAEELDAADESRIEGARGPSVVGEQRRAKTAGLAGMIVAVALLCGLVFGGTWWLGQWGTSAMTPPAQPKKEKVGQVIPDIKTDPVTTPRDEPAPPPPPSPDLITNLLIPQQPVASQPAAEPKTREELLREQRGAPGFGTSGSKGGAPQQQITIAPDSRQDDAYSKMLRPTHTAMAAARTLGDLDYIVTKGTVVPCVLAFDIVTTQPGPIACNLAAPLLSASGRVVLLSNGAEITGLQRGGITQGQAAIFALWERARDGRVVVDMDSPAAGAMGSSGLPGYVDTHFWERFGGTIMLSLISDFGQAVANTQRGDGQSISFGNTASGAENAAAEALKNSINIPPTLYKFAGERVNIILARDLDFSSVYRLQAR